MKVAEISEDEQPSEVKSNQGDLEPHERKFILFGSLGLLFLTSIPLLYSFAVARPASLNLEFPFNTDDHMVYGAWMFQAMQGHFLFDNRFTTNAQPQETFHLYFLILGWISKVFGISLASNLARIGLSGFIVPAIYKIVSGITDNIYSRKLISAMTIFGGGLGFLVWHNFGRALVLERSLWMKPFTLGQLPTDIWQPEGFVFPSLLTNGLFVISFLLIFSIFWSVIEARINFSWKPVAIGAASFAVLMNIHSYDALLVTLVLVGLLAASAYQKQLNSRWVFKVILMGVGAIPPALWFIHVIRTDPVFASRAATPTFSANFRSMIIGYLPMIAFGLPYLLFRGKTAKEISRPRLIGFLIFGAIVIMSWITATNSDNLAFTQIAWAIIFALTLVACALLSDENPTTNLIIAWALVGLIAPYFPALFQRKLAMGLSIPWAILAGLQLAHIVQNSFRTSRNFGTVFVLLLFGATSLQWVFRELNLIRTNVSSTTVQPVYLGEDSKQIILYLRKMSDTRTVVVAVPGIPSRVVDPATGLAVPDQYGTPLIPDLNPILSGLAGVYTYAGHWSETPDYDKKRNDLLQFVFLSKADPIQAMSFLRSIGCDFIVGPSPGSLPGSSFIDVARYGKVLIKGSQFELVKVSPA